MSEHGPMWRMIGPVNITVSEPAEDVLGPDWVSRTIHLPPDEEGDVVATVVSAADGPRHGRSVLYVHGFVDYFFHAEHAARWIDRGYDFYAIDLRKYGRSMRPHQTPNDVRDLRTYGADLGAALRVVRAEHDDGAPVVLLGTSTGGLITALWAHGHPGEIDALVLNSPWFELNEPWYERTLFTWALHAMAKVVPQVPIRGLAPYYGRAIHVDTGGRWDYDLAWKPHEGFIAHAGWSSAIRRGHARLQRGLAIDVPVLVCASTRSGPADRPSAALADADCVLNVADMVRFAPGLGPDVTIERIEGGIHDLALSAPEPRARYERAVFAWLEARLPG